MKMRDVAAKFGIQDHLRYSGASSICRCLCAVAKSSWNFIQVAFLLVSALRAVHHRCHVSGHKKTHVSKLPRTSWFGGELKETPLFAQ